MCRVVWRSGGKSGELPGGVPGEGLAGVRVDGAISAGGSACGAAVGVVVPAGGVAGGARCARRVGCRGPS